MTALSGGERLDDGSSPMNSVLERPNVAADARRAPRSLDEIFPPRGDASRGLQLQETWRAFGSEMDGAVRAAFDASRSPPEIAYAIGEIVHNYFRTRGATLTSYELRRLVAELLAQQDRGRQDRGPEPRSAGPSLVTFSGEPAARETSWTGDETGTPGPVVPDVVFEGPPSRLVNVVPRDPDAALLAEVTARARARLVVDAEGRLPREAASGAIDAALGDVLQGEPERRERLARLALSELCGLGPIDRLWADRSVRAVFVNGPTAIYVERNGVLEPSTEQVSRPGASAGTRWPSGPTVFVGRCSLPPARRRRRAGGLSARRARRAGSGPAPRRAGQRNLRTPDRRRDARPADGRPSAHSRAQSPQRARHRAGGFRQDGAAGRHRARPRRCESRHPGAAPRVSLAVGIESRTGRAVGRILCDAAGGRRAIAARSADRRSAATGRRVGIDRAPVARRSRDGRGRSSRRRWRPRFGWRSTSSFVWAGRAMDCSAWFRWKTRPVRGFSTTTKMGFHRRTMTPSFAGSVQKAGYGEALSSVLR